MVQQTLTLNSQRDPAARPHEQGLTDQILQPLHLHAQRGLAAANTNRGSAERTRLRHSREAAQEVDIERMCHQRA